MTVSPAKHHHTTLLHGGNHIWSSSVHLLCLSKTRRLKPKISNLDSTDQRTDFHLSNVHCLCFFTQASLFLLLVSFSSGFFAAICQICQFVCYLNSEAFMWAGNSNEFILCSRGNSGSSFPVVVLMGASFIIVLDVFCYCT